ncbi:MAG: hypothetical protein ACOYEV_08925 [Candidatus Nanopelagicales bacterium]
MTTWRDIADQLTPAQVELLEWLEGDPLNGILVGAKQHLKIARGWAAENLEQSLHADIPPPADAVEVGPWRKSKDGVRRRTYQSARTGIAGLDIALELSGSQDTEGRIECRITLAGALTDIEPAAARELATALVAAADEIEGR